MAEPFKFDNRKQRRSNLAQARRTMRKFKKNRGKSITLENKDGPAGH